MIQLEIDNIALEVKEGTMLIEAARQADVYIPHFCYHPKLSIAANCRMCLVEVEKAPKPMPACATPVTQGMRVYTQSDKAKAAQKSVMEFLLINHPLDCPICDQGGECQLQDLSVGYGSNKSRYQEEKRVVLYKDVGSLISMQEMSRCIHCTRCVRFGQELAGVMELGMLNRGEHSEITSFVGEAVSSELSGNMIDICPVGALTSKPFRYQARTWEMARRATISAHDALGSALIAQTKNNQLLRVIAGQNDEINECWITDRDRFSYEGLNHQERLGKPMVRDQNGTLQTTDWQDALQILQQKYSDIKKHKPQVSAFGMANPAQTVEELFLFKHYLQNIAPNYAHLEFRFKQMDFAFDEVQTPKAMQGLTLDQFETFQHVFLIGSFLNNDQAILGLRLRKMLKKGAKVYNFHAISGQDWGVELQQDTVVPPYLWAGYWLCVKQYVLNQSIAVPGLPEKYVQDAKRTAAVLIDCKGSDLENSKAAFILGSAIVNHPKRSFIFDTLNVIGAALNIRLQVLLEAANTLGAYGLEMHTKNTQVLPSYDVDMIFNLGVEMQDVAEREAMLEYTKKASLKVYLGSFINQDILDAYDIILPIASHFETSGTLVNMFGAAQSFQGVAKPFEEARPAWKVLKVMTDFAHINTPVFTSSEEVRDVALPLLQKHLNTLKQMAGQILNLDEYVKNPRQNNAPLHFERLSYTPIYASDALVRRATALQKTPQTKAMDYIYVHPSILKNLNLEQGEAVNVLQGQKMLQAKIMKNDLLDPLVVYIPMVGATAQQLGAMYGDLAIEKIDKI